MEIAMSMRYESVEIQLLLFETVVAVVVIETAASQSIGIDDSF